MTTTTDPVTTAHSLVERLQAKRQALLDRVRGGEQVTVDIAAVDEEIDKARRAVERTQSAAVEVEQRQAEEKRRQLAEEAQQVAVDTFGDGALDAAVLDKFEAVRVAVAELVDACTDRNTRLQQVVEPLRSYHDVITDGPRANGVASGDMIDVAGRHVTPVEPLRLLAEAATPALQAHNVRDAGSVTVSQLRKAARVGKYGDPERGVSALLRPRDA